MIVNSSAAKVFPLQELAKGIPHEDFSILHAAIAPKGSWSFPESASLPPDAKFEFEAGRLVRIWGWGGRVVVNRQCELYSDITEADVNHLGTVAMGLTLAESGVVTTNTDLARRRFRRNFGLVTTQPVHYGVERAFQGELLRVEQPIHPILSPLKENIWNMLPTLLSGTSYKLMANKLRISERMLTYTIQKACEQIGASKFGAVVTHSHLIDPNFDVGNMS